MAFDSLSEKLQNVFKNLRSKGRLTEADVKAALKEVKMALLEADVNFKVVKQFVKSVEVHRGELLFTRKNTPDLVGMAAYVFETPEKLMMPDLIFRLVTNERMTPIFLWQLINNREFRPVIQGISGGSAKSMSNISKERLKNIEVICPPISEQKKLEGVLEQVDKSKVMNVI